MKASKLVPLCECHSETMLWSKNSKLAAGGTWRCGVKNRENCRRWYAANREKQIQSVTRWIANNPDKRREHQRNWRVNNPETAKRSVRRAYLKAEYGMTLEQYDEMLSHQDGVCAVCKSQCVVGIRLAVDHDHATGRIRGLLCVKCNRGIGSFDDDPERLIAASRYLDVAVPS